jgi:sulfur transfer protein SufE
MDTNLINYLSKVGSYTDEKITEEDHLAGCQVDLWQQHLMLEVVVFTYQQNIHKV